MAVHGLRGCLLFRPNEYQEIPDGGWGWLVAVAFFLVEMFTYGTIKSFGIFLQDLVKQFGESNSKVSWVLSICVFIMTFMAPLASVLSNRFGFQPVVMLGGVLISLGTITTAFTTSIFQMYITMGMVAGLGYCLTFLPTVTILSQYFDRRRSLVTALASTGESVAMFALAPAFSALRDHMGWRHTMVVIGALQGIVILCGALLRPIVIRPTRQEEKVALSRDESPTTEWNPSLTAATTTTTTTKARHDGDTKPTHGDSLSSDDSGVSSEEGPEGRMMKDTCEKKATGVGESDARRSAGGDEEEKLGTDDEVKREDGGEPAVASRPKAKLLDFSILREGSFICYSLFGLFATLGFFAPPLYIIELSVSRGVERERASCMLSIMAVAEVVGRLSAGWLLSRPWVRRQKLMVLLGCVVGMTLVLLAFALVREFYGLAVCCSGFGFFMGCISCSHIPMLAEDDVVGIQRMASAAGVYVFIQSFAGLAGPPLGGFFVDKTQNYGSAFYSCAAGMGLGALFLGLVRPAKRWSPCMKRSDHPEGEAQPAERQDVTERRTKPSDEGGATLRGHEEIVVDLVQDQREGAERNGKTEAGCV
ncbi:monocarboxylate transporter 7 isoform X1 [Gadus morhua]|nr:monocarboxylate transporter 7-like isoform X1 [Gadus morhua]